MLHKTFKDLKGRISANPNIKSVQWFNAQYDGTIHLDPAVFIEFPGLINVTPVTTAYASAEIPIKLHVATSLVSEQEGGAPEYAIAEHDALVAWIVLQLKGQKIAFKGDSFSLEFKGFQYYQLHRGWLITFLNFSLPVGMLK